MSGRVAIFGAGGGGRRALKWLRRDHRVVAFLDNDPRKQGGRLAGLPVIAPSALGEIAADLVYVASASFYADMARQLGDLGLAPERIRAVPWHVLHTQERRLSPFCAAYFGLWLLLIALVAWGVLR